MEMKVKNLNQTLMEENARLEEENKKLKEFKTKREESMFYFKAQMERAEPKTAREAEDLQKAKEMFEKLYREKLYYLEEENKKLKEELGEYKKMFEDQLKEVYIKNTAEFLDKKFPKIN